MLAQNFTSNISRKGVWILTSVVLVLLILHPGFTENSEKQNEINVTTFYYPWYGNPEIDGEYRHWNHQKMLETGNPESYPGGDDIGANFYPELGCYSRNDPKIIDQHMKWIRDSKIDTICLSWWGVDSFEDKATPLILDKASEYGITVNFHLEPFEDRDASSTRDAVEYIIDKYGDHPAFYRDSSYGNRPLFYLYDSYNEESSGWASILQPDGIKTIRDTKYDSVMIALWVKPHEEDFILDSGFDGFYTYFGIDGFSYGSTPSNWEQLSNWADENNKIFIPCVGPGYIDTRIRPWNDRNTRSREKGNYYDRMFYHAIKSDPHTIAITSFNEWHEGSQIEPAIPKTIHEYAYSSYNQLDSDFYLNRTHYWVNLIRSYESGDHSSLERHSFGDEFDVRIDHLARECDVSLHTVFSPQYDGGAGAEALVDGIIGSENYLDGKWVGIEGEDVYVDFKFKKPTDIKSIRIRFLQDSNSWIFLPGSIKLFVNGGSGTFREEVTVIPTYNVKEPFIHEVLLFGEDAEGSQDTFIDWLQNVGKISITIINNKVCPKGHPGEGLPAWLFIDEIIVE